jgi:N-methylhydantoinase B
MGNGLAGGYPANNTTQWIAKNSNILDRLKRGDFPRDIEEIGGEWESLPAHYVRPFNDDEVFIAYESGGGGFGDPIERDPQLVLKDAELGYVSLEAAKEMYGVVIDTLEPKVDNEKTKVLRQKIIAKRLKVGKH